MREKIKKWFFGNPEETVVYIRWNEMKYWKKGEDIRCSLEETFFFDTRILVRKDKMFTKGKLLYLKGD